MATFTSGIKVLPGYPLQCGDKYVVVFDFAGPVSYSRTTGIVINALTSGLNLSGFDWAQATEDTTNTFDAQIQFSAGGFGNAVPSLILRPVSIVTATAGGQSQTAGTEAAAGTNLSQFSFRIMAYMV
jgi:hypothetical protein